jgi:hypothetical protein
MAGPLLGSLAAGRTALGGYATRGLASGRSIGSGLAAGRLPWARPVRRSSGMLGMAGTALAGAAAAYFMDPVHGKTRRDGAMRKAQDLLGTARTRFGGLTGAGQSTGSANDSPGEPAL